MISTNLERITINELAGLLEMSTHSLRYWEKHLSINVPRNSKGSRVYCGNALKLFKKIQDLVRTGLELKEVKTQLNRAILSYNETVLSYNQNGKPRVEIYEENETENNLLLKTFTSQLDKAQNEIKQLIYENADLKGKVTFFELKAREHEKNINMVLESKQETIEILREEKVKKETDLEESQKEMMTLKEEKIKDEKDLESKQETIEILNDEKEKLEKVIEQLKEQNNKPEEKKGLFDFLFMKV